MDPIALLFAVHAGIQYVQADDFASLGLRTEVETLIRPNYHFAVGPVGTLTFCGEQSTVIFGSLGIRAIVRPIPDVFFGGTLSSVWVHAIGSSTEQAIEPELVVGGNLGWVGSAHVQLVANASTFSLDGTNVFEIGLAVGFQHASF